MQSTAEVLDHEDPPRAPRWVWVALIVVLVVGGAAWAVDEYRRTQEAGALADCRSQLRGADQSASARLGRVADYLRPSLANLPPDQARRLAEPMRSPARIALPRLRAALEVCREVSVWPWHEPDDTRRDDTVAYADRLLHRLQEIADVGGTYFEADPELDRLRARAYVS